MAGGAGDPDAGAHTRRRHRPRRRRTAPTPALAADADRGARRRSPPRLRRPRRRRRRRRRRHRAPRRAHPDAHADTDAHPHGHAHGRPHPDGTPTTPPPAPASGAAAAIAFARAQIGDPYQWGAAGPDKWDCSGLTMRRVAGGRRLAAALLSRPVRRLHADRRGRPAARRPGVLGLVEQPVVDLPRRPVHRRREIVHAPRTGEDVAEVSIDYWISPNFFARPCTPSDARP